MAWVTALNSADSNNLRELVRALLVVAPVPDWVREELTPLFKDDAHFRTPNAGSRKASSCSVNSRQPKRVSGINYPIRT